MHVAWSESDTEGGICRSSAGDAMESDDDSGAAAIRGRGSEKETWIDLNFCFFFVYVFLREVMNFIMFLRVLVV